MTNCEICGASPAARIKLKRGVGLLLVQRIYKADAMLCQSCAKKATAEFQRETLKKGWTSPRSALMNPFYMAGNAINQSRHERKLTNDGDFEPVNDYQRQETKPSTGPQLTSNGAHPVDVLAAFMPDDETQKSQLAALLIDFSGGGVISSPESIAAATHQPNRQEAEQMLEIASSLIEAAQVSGGLGAGLPHALFVSEMEERTGIPLAEFSSVQRAISAAVSEAAFQLCSVRRMDEALGAAVLACVLFANSSNWERTRY
jgi:hypothetical protein